MSRGQRSVDAPRLGHRRGAGEAAAGAAGPPAGDVASAGGTAAVRVVLDCDLWLVEWPNGTRTLGMPWVTIRGARGRARHATGIVGFPVKVLAKGTMLEITVNEDESC